MSAIDQHQNESLLDLEIKAAMKRGLQEPHADFTSELMSIIAQDEAAPAVQRVKPSRLPFTLVAVGVVYLIIALLIPTSDTATSSFTWTGSAVYTIGALALISLLGMTQQRPRTL